MPCITRSSVAMVSNMHGNWGHISPKEGVQLPVPSEGQAMKKYIDVINFYIFYKKNHHIRG